MTLQFSLKTTAAEKLRTQCLVLPVQAGRLTPTGAAIDARLDNALSAILKAGDLGKKPGSTQLVPTSVKGLPRILLGMLAGAALAVAGAVMQALFRNPLAEPGLVGVSVGGAVGAVGAIVLGYDQQPLVLAGAAFAGSLLATLAACALGRKAPGSAGILLAGIAINAFGGAMLGVFTYMATDDQLRSLTLWNLGSLGTAAQTACPAFAGRRFLHSGPAPYMNSLLRTRHKSP